MMTIPTTTPFPLWRWLKQELAPSLGRGDAVLRYVVSCGLVIAVSMCLQVPFLTLSLIMVFFTAQDNTVLTRLSGVMLLVGGTLAIGVACLLIKFASDNPPLRLLCASALVFAGMYFLRISKLGPMGYLLALLIILSQSFFDLVPSPELLMRVTLYTWVATLYPIVITMLVSALLRPADPRRRLRAGLVAQLADVAAIMDGWPVPAAAAHFEYAERMGYGLLALHRHLAFAAMADAGIAAHKARYQLYIATADRLYTAATHLDVAAASATELDAVRQTLRIWRAAILGQHDFRLATPIPALAAPALAEMADALNALAAFDFGSLPAPASAPAESLCAPDAWTNPLYARYALKTLLATLICYVFYTAVQWPGIHTSMLTCIIVALPGLGAVTHKSALRIGGCLVGSLLALVATIFVVPHLDGLGGLLLMTLPVIALGGWVAAGSARSNYIGLQIVFAFSLALLDSFGPVSDLTEIRDRLIGIVVGIAVSAVVYSGLWPEREAGALRQGMSKLLRSYAALALATQASAPTPAQRQTLARLRTQSWSVLAATREQCSRVALEPGNAGLGVDLRNWLAAARQALLAVNHVQTLASHTAQQSQQAPHHALTAALAQQLERMAEQLQPAAPPATVHADAGQPVPPSLPALPPELAAALTTATQCLCALQTHTRQVATALFAAEPA